MNYQLNIGWLYPDLMNTYGDRGNIIVFKKRCEWRNIEVEVLELNVGFDVEDLKKCDLLFMGGAQDRQQQIVSDDLNKKSKILKNVIEQGTPGLYICGAYQFLGKYYKEPNGNIIKGLGIFDLYTESKENQPRLIGNIAIEPLIPDTRYQIPVLIGFENHGGKTYLGKNIEALGTARVGFGNNGEDKTEGAIYKESIGTYLHGPVLPKNPLLADSIIEKALERKYKKIINLEKLDDFYEQKARVSIAKRLKIEV